MMKNKDLKIYEDSLTWIEENEDVVRSELRNFICDNKNFKCQVDLYFYPKTHEFDEFVNVSGAEWLNDDHICIYSINGTFLEFNDDMEAWIYDSVENAYFDVISSLEVKIQDMEELIKLEDEFEM